MIGIGVMSGYGVKIRQLQNHDLELYPKLKDRVAFDEEGKFPIDWCVAVFGEDLAEGLAAVVYVGPTKELVWHDQSVVSGQKLTNIPNPHSFVEAVMEVVHGVHPNVV